MKPQNLKNAYLNGEVAPYVGAWIETRVSIFFRCGKHVAPYVGAWSETSVYGHVRNTEHVAPYVGAWIETG